MPTVLSDTTIRRRDVKAKLGWGELKALIAEAAMTECGIPGAPGVNGVTVDVTLEQRKEGSPSYNIGEWTAAVTVTLPVD